MPKLIVREGLVDREVDLGGGVTIGRQPDNQVVLADPAASRRHAAIVEEWGRYFLQDLGSANGTRLNGAPVSRHPLATGDLVQIGEATLRFRDDALADDPAYAPTALGIPAFQAPARNEYPAIEHPAVEHPAVRPIPLTVPAPADCQPVAALVVSPPFADARGAEASPTASSSPPAVFPAAPVADSPVAASQPASVAAGTASFAYAGFWRRLAAALIDGVLLGIPFYLLRRPVFALFGGIEPDALALGFAVLQLVVTTLYFARWESAASGATFGKRLLGIRVVDEAGQRVGFGKALARNLGKILSGAICGLGFLFVAFTMRKCAWHDSLAGCLVVKASSVPAGAAARACASCGAALRQGISFCTQCGRRID